ncbi:MAG: GntP family permease [Peptostreptococcaceae bacterium]
MQITTFGALFGLFTAIILIMKHFQPVYSLMIGALVGGLIGGASLVDTIDYMMIGASNISPSILRVLASGILAGCLIKSGAVDKISESIIDLLGIKKAILGIALSTMALAGVGVNLDVAIITVAPVGLYIGKKLNISKMAILLALAGGGKAGNIISPNPNTLAVAENFNVELSSVMIANLIPSIFGVILTVFMAKLLIDKGSKIEVDSIEEQKELPSLLNSLAGPFVAIGLLFLGNISSIVIDPLVALPIGGVVCLIATKNLSHINEYFSYGLSQMQGVCILLLGTGTLAGIIQVSNLEQSTINLLAILNMPQFLLAPISGMLMSLATASSTAGATIASSTFSEAIIDSGLSNMAGASIINAGASTFEQFPHGSLFHTSAKSVNMNISERFKLLPYEVAVGTLMTILSTSMYLIKF